MAGFTKASIRQKFSRMQSNWFSGANVTCLYRGETFTAIRNDLSLEQTAAFHGLGEDYDFVLHANLADVTSTVRTNERIVLSGADVGGEDLTMRIMGKSIDAVDGVIRLSVKHLYE
jgi:hypothetical protein